MKVPPIVAKAFREAVRARQKAHAPYSEFRVGAAFVSGRKVISGCNVENASYGGAICAERTAVVKAVSEGTTGPFSDLVVVAENTSGKPVAPCGLCLQVIAEFCPGTLRIWAGTPRGLESCFTLDQLMPVRFGRGDLKVGVRRKR